MGLLVFGGSDPVTNQDGYENAFEAGFCERKCLEAWAKVGAAPCTMACLESTKVRHELGADELTKTMIPWLKSTETCKPRMTFVSTG